MGCWCEGAFEGGAEGKGRRVGEEERRGRKGGRVRGGGGMGLGWGGVEIGEESLVFVCLLGGWVCEE